MISLFIVVLSFCLSVNDVQAKDEEDQARSYSKQNISKDDVQAKNKEDRAVNGGLSDIKKRKKPTKNKEDRVNGVLSDIRKRKNPTKNKEDRVNGVLSDIRKRKKPAKNKEDWAVDGGIQIYDDRTVDATVQRDVYQLMNTVVDVIVADEDGTEDKTSSGSGFIVSEDGYIVTNLHVIDSCDSVRIATADGKRYVAKVVGKDEYDDVALLKINLSKNMRLSPVKFGNSDKIKIFDRVIAVGNPFGLGKTATLGSILRKNGNFDQASVFGDNKQFSSYIQANVNINYGNSGGPLFLEKGEKVIGMITAFIPGSGICFAIPSNFLQKIIRQLKVFGKIKRSWLGISACRMPSDASSILLGRSDGYYVASVSEESPAMSAGIQEGDIILKVNKTDINKEINIENLLNNLPIGKVIPIQIMRGEETRMMSIKVKDYNDADISFLDETDDLIKDIPHEKIEIAGLVLRLADIGKLTKKVKKKFRISSDDNGVFVLFVGSSSIDNSAVRVGSLISQVNKKRISNLVDLKVALKETKGENGVVLFVKDPLMIRNPEFVVINCGSEKSSKRKALR